jgi:glycosyltransferase involved in cell wall biosynthesis
LNLADYQVVVVDNANEGSWYHPLTEGLVHLGGDNSAFEFSAFERGISFLEASGAKPDLYVLVTDAYLAYGSDYLDLIDRRALKHSIDFQACVGWADSFLQECTLLGYTYKTWLRTSFLLVPAALMPKIWPLKTPLDKARFFSSNPAEPFLPTAPMSSNLRDLILSWLTKNKGSLESDQEWHSQFELTAENFDYFKNKACAIFREHLLSARLQKEGFNCYDFRLVRHLSQRRDKVSIEQQTEWQWLGWRETFDYRPPLLHVEECNLPEVAQHGASNKLAVRGWVISQPQVRYVELRFSSGQVFPASCDIARPDVLSENPGFTDDRCGFYIIEDLNELPVGQHDLELSVPQIHFTENLGTVRVLPSFDIEEVKAFVSDSISPDREAPLSIETTVRSSERIDQVELHCDSQQTNLEPTLAEEPRQNNGAYRFLVTVSGLIGPLDAERQHVLELIFSTEDRNTHSWTYPFFIKGEHLVPYSIVHREIGLFNADTRRTRVRLEGSIYSARPFDRIVLKRSGKEVLQDEMFTEPLPGSEAVLGRFAVSRSVSNIPPGPWEFELAVKKAGKRSVIPLERWRSTVRMLKPTIHVADLDAEPLEDIDGKYMLKIAGWTTNTSLLNCLQLFVDDSLCSLIYLDKLRPEMKSTPNGGQTILQAFEENTTVSVDPGEHLIRLVTVKENGPTCEWSRTQLFEETEDETFRLYSKDLAELKSQERLPTSSWLNVRGTVRSELDGIVLDLYVDGDLVDQCPVGKDNRFHLRWLPPKAATYEIRVLARWQKRILYDSGRVRSEAQRLRAPKRTQLALRRFLEYFEIDAFNGLSGEELALLILDQEMDKLPEFIRTIHRIDRKLRSSATNRKQELTSVDLDSLPTRPLKVLMACWEVPCMRHGGGVCLTNLLKNLSKKHQLTLVHSYGLEEKNWVNDAKPYVDRLISVPRRHQETHYRTEAGLPEPYYFNYTPELRAAIEKELATTKYDLVNYEYATMYPHIAPGRVSRLLVVHEYPISAKLTHYFKDPSAVDKNTNQLRDLLRTVYFLSELLPSKCDNLLALTEEDAEDLLELDTGAEIYVNKIGVDCTNLAPPPKRESPFEQPGEMGNTMFVFLGNFRHPPNRKAVEFFGLQVMPRILEENPHALFAVVGGFVPDKLARLEGKNNIHFQGFVDDFRPYLWNATAFVTPLFTGSGMRVKNLEALACGCPIIGTKLSMQGMEATAGQHYLRAETAVEFAEQACKLMKYPELWNTLRKASLDLAESRHDWPIRAREREAIWQQIIDRREYRRKKS